MSHQRAVLIVDHGSRREAANAQTRDLAARIAERRPDCIVEVAHLDITSPSIREGIEACVAAGAREIVVQPFFLAPGQHSARDIPREIAEAAPHHPDVAFRLGEVIGVDDGVVDLLLRRVDDAGPASS